MSERPLFIPVLLGTVRKGRASEPVARLIHAEIAQRPGVETELIDIAKLPLVVDDAGNDAPIAGYREAMERMDGLVIVSPEYNHSFPGLLKHVLDSALKEYVHKAVGIVGVSAGPFGGTRGIENLLPVMRELGLVTIFWDVNFGAAHKQFDAEGKLLDDAWRTRIDKFLKELIWMSRVLRHGREHVALD
jgi:NAD(P)H-dependent FMN reductase